MINLPKWIKDELLLIACVTVGIIAGAIITLIVIGLMIRDSHAAAEEVWPVPIPRQSAFVAPLPEKRP